MKKIRLITVFLILAVVLTVALNYEVSTKQGFDTEMRIIRIPLYLKALDFFDRYFNYKVLSARITKGVAGDEEKAMALLAWTHENIKKNPQSLPVIDDHAWHIIVRGYGLDDQFQDVFTTLCNHAGLNAFFYSLPTAEDPKRKKPLSFVMLNGEWAVFDAYKGVYFRAKGGKERRTFATVSQIAAGDWEVSPLDGGDTSWDYAPYFKNILSIDYRDWGISRPAIQSPFRRFIYFLKGEPKS